MTTIAILGAGNGGQAAAAHLTLDGHSVRLFERFPEIVEPFRASRQITIRGEISGTATVEIVTSNVGEAVEGAELILVTVPGFALGWMASESPRIYATARSSCSTPEARAVPSRFGAYGPSAASRPMSRSRRPRRSSTPAG